MHRVTPRTAVLALVALLVAAVIAGCGEASGAKKETAVQQDNYKRLVAQQPAHTMAYSPTRDTINFWIDTWGKPGKLAYVYLQAGNGQLIGYYILKGLPVSYCASQTPNYRIHGGDGDVLTPAPGIDGVYYSGGQCNSYYGRDASNNAYVEYTVGGSQNVLVYDRPLPKADVEPLAFATVENVK